MNQEMLLISEAAKRVEVETHVLRYWEEELQLPIKRNEMGHRYYTMEDVKRFQEIKRLKEQGLQLKAIRTVIQKGDTGEQELVLGKREKYIISLSKDESKEEKIARLQYLLQQMMTEAVKTANQELCTEMKESVIKELDYQFRAREEREEEHWQKEEEHFRKLDELLREKNKTKDKTGKFSKEARKEKKPGFRFK